MPPFVVLGDSAVYNLLIHLPKNDIISFQKALEACLRKFSVGNERDYQLPPGIVTRPNGQQTLFRPFTSPESIGAKMVVVPAPDRKLPLQGLVALCDDNGLPAGVINAEELTGYRTSLTAIIPYLRRRRTQNMVVFGAGKQALWHMRLALALRGAEIDTITIVNRTRPRAEALLKTVEEENERHWKSGVRLTILDSSQPEYGDNLAGALRDSDVIFCTVGSSKPLFPLASVLKDRSRESLPFISAVGSWQPDMMELDPEMLRYVAGLGMSDEVSVSSGMVMTDDINEALVKSGEIIQSGLGADQIFEVGQVLEWGEDASRMPHTSPERLNLCLEEGFLIFKVVGVSVTDLAAGNEILSLARDRGVGVMIQDF